MDSAYVLIVGHIGATGLRSGSCRFLCTIVHFILWDNDASRMESRRVKTNFQDLTERMAIRLQTTNPSFIHGRRSNGATIRSPAPRRLVQNQCKILENLNQRSSLADRCAKDFRMYISVLSSKSAKREFVDSKTKLTKIATFDWLYL